MFFPPILGTVAFSLVKIEEYTVAWIMWLVDVSGHFLLPWSQLLHLGRALKPWVGFFEGGSVLFPAVVLKPWGSTVDAPGLTLTCWVVGPQSWPVALLSMNSQTPHSTDRLSSGKGHPSHFAYFLGVFLFVSGQGMSLFTSSEGFALWASVGPFPETPLSCQEVTGSLLSIVKSHRYTFS